MTFFDFLFLYSFLQLFLTFCGVFLYFFLFLFDFGLFDEVKKKEKDQVF